MWQDPLNDLTRPLALVLAALMAPAGAVLGLVLAVVVSDRVPGVGMVVVPVLSLLLLAAVATWYLVSLRREDARMAASLAAGADELVRGEVAGTTVPARVVQSLPDRSGRPVAALGGPRAERGRRVLATALTPPGPRRVAALVPDLGPLRRGAPVALALHPTRRDLAALDARVDAAALAAGDADPRWSGPLPTHGSVTGGWGPKLAAVVGSLALFAVLSAAVTVATGSEPVDRYAAAAAPTT